MYTIYKLSRTIAGATLSRLPDFFSARFIYRLFLVMTDVTNLMLLNVLVIIGEITGGLGRLFLIISFCSSLDLAVGERDSWYS